MASEPIPEIVDRLLDAYGQDEFARVLAHGRDQIDLDLLRAMARRVSAALLRNAQEALGMARAIQATADALADSPDKIVAMGLAQWVMGNALQHASQYHAALDHYRRAQQIYASAGHDRVVIGMQINQVGVLQEMGEYQAALDLAEEARRACGELGEEARSYLATLEMNVGSAWQQLGEPTHAMAAYERGRALFVALGNEIQTARMDINRANVLEEMDRFDQAAALLEQARSVLHQGGLDQEVARADLNLGRLAYRRGHYQHALVRLESARTGFAAIPNPSEVALVDLHRSYVYRDLNLLHESITLAAQSLNRAAARWQKARALIVQGVGYRRLGIYAEADRLLARARRLLHQQGAHTRLLRLDVERAQLALVQGRVGTARRLARRVDRQLHSQDWPSLAAQVHLILAHCALAGDDAASLDQAEGEVAQALSILTDHPQAETAIQARRLLGQIYRHRGDLPAACREVLAAIQSVEELRSRLPMDEFQMGFMEDKLSLYADLVRLRMALGSPDQVLFALNLASSAPLSHLAPTDTPGAQQLSAADQALHGQIQTLREQWHWYQAKLERPLDEDQDRDGDEPRRGGGAGQSVDEVRSHLAAAEEQLAELTRRWRVRRADAQTGAPALLAPGSPDDAMRFSASLRASLADDEILLHYFVMDGAFHVAAVNRAGIILVTDLVQVDELQRLLKSWRFQMEHAGSMGLVTGNEGAARRVLSHLSRMYGSLCAPLAAHMAQARRLYLVLPPGWHDLPFAAFYDGEAYLVARHELVHLSAPDVLLQPARLGANRAGGALVLGYSDGQRLIHAPAEAAQVTEILAPALSAHTLVENGATMSAFQEASRTSRLLHLATHATFRPDNPLFSWMRLADARLTVADLYEISLPMRPLVVLSACETGRGTPRGGGLLGMGRGFLAAGATGLVVSLWKVADQASAQLMADFYTHLVARDLSDPGAALAAAQRRSMHNHPFFWAGFIFIQG